MEMLVRLCFAQVNLHSPFAHPPSFTIYTLEPLYHLLCYTIILTFLIIGMGRVVSAIQLILRS